MDKAHAATAKHDGAGRMHMKSQRRHAAGMRSMGPRSASHPTDNVADQLNREEAQRLSGSSMPPQQMQPMPPSHMQQPMYQGR